MNLSIPMRLSALLGLSGALGLVGCGSSSSDSNLQAPSGPGGAGTTSSAMSAGNATSTTAAGSTSAGTGGAGVTGSTSGAGDASSSTSGAGGGGPVSCKRGIASNVAPGAAFFPSLTWRYNWALQSGGADVGLEFVPMVWGATSLGKALPPGSKFVLGFNEPNFKAQSNLTPQQAAADWPMVEAQASAIGAAIVSPAMNFCGPDPDKNCNGANPYQYLKDFFAACPGCKVDYVAVHWYNCDLQSLKDYLEPGGTLDGFEQFGKPIWLTEFSCGGGSSEAEQEAYMKAAIPYLEANPHVFRYSWFSAGPIPNAELIKADGSPTPLGQVYIGLPQSCP